MTVRALKTAVPVTIIVCAGLAWASGPSVPVSVEEGQFEVKCTEQSEADGRFQCKYPYITLKNLTDPDKSSNDQKKYFITSSSTILPSSTPLAQRDVRELFRTTLHSEVCRALGRRPEVNGRLYTESRAVTSGELIRENAGLAAFVTRSNVYIQSDANTLNLEPELYARAGIAPAAVIVVQTCGAKLSYIDSIFQ
ncbi:MAG: hypothetical protein AB7G93_17170 [Bdellovibrionales bacterium]